MKRYILPLISVLFCAVSAVFGQDNVPKELDEYLALPDDSYSWKLLESKDVEGAKTLTLELTSQTWHGNVWKHALYIVQPSRLDESGCGILYITGGAIGQGVRSGEAEIARQLAKDSGMTTAMLYQVPNQPSLGPYVEDELIGETFLKALESGDWTWPLLFPMTKSAIRAMDAVQEAAKAHLKQDVKKFVVTGASKRGWTTWLTGASQDKRVIAIAPMVINTLDILNQMEYQKDLWGDYSVQVGDYTSRNLVQKGSDEKRNEATARVFAMVDPFSYLSRVRIPKLLIHGMNDEYWSIDALKFYWNKMVGPKYVLNLPNVGHGLGEHRPYALKTIAAFARYAAEGESWPSMTWKRAVGDGGYTVTVASELPARSVKLWTATSKDHDFRQSKWESKDVAWENGFCKVEIPKPAEGHIAYYVALELRLPEGFEATFTTEVWRDGE